MSTQTHAQLNVLEARALATTHADRIALISALLLDGFSPETRSRTLAKLEEHDLNPTRSFEVVMHRTGWNQVEGPESSEDTETQCYMVEVDAVKYDTDEAAIEEALDKAWNLFDEYLKPFEQRSGWSYTIESGKVHEYFPAKLEFGEWFTPAANIQIKETTVAP